MATSKITLYRSEIIPDRNAWVENTHEYLVKKAIKTYEADNFQYQKIAINKTITISASQETVGDQSLGNYCEIEQDNRSYFYFITNVAWTSKCAVKVDLSMDTINTFGEDLEFLPQTSISREHRDRFDRMSGVDNKIGKKRLIRLVDRQPEHLQLPKDLKSSAKITQSGLDYNWFLIYKTREGLTADNPGNPVECGLVADVPLLIKKGTSNNPSVTFKNSDIEANKIYYIDATNNPGGAWHYSTYPDRIQHTAEGSVLVFWKKDDNDALGRILRYRRVGDSWSLMETGNNITLSLPITFLNMRSLGVSDGTAPGAIINGYNDIINLPFRRAINAGTIKDLSTKPFSQIDKTDSKLMKIIRLPYAPVHISKSGSGEYVFPSDWYLSDGIMKLSTINLSNEFGNKIGDILLDDYLKVETTADPTRKKEMNNESKLFNSDVRTIKCVYDSFYKDIKLENVKIKMSESNKDLNIPVTFKPTNTVNSKFAFKIDKTPWTFDSPAVKFATQEDFENYMIVDRNNEETIFSNDFLNYIRNGINYDKKARNLAAVASGVSAMIGMGSTIGTAALSMQSQNKVLSGTKRLERMTPHSGIGAGLAERFKNVGKNSSDILSAAAINVGFNAANAAINGITSYISATDAIERKKQELSQQATSVSGADDVDLLQYYTDNRLQIKDYDTEEVAKQNVYNLFFYAGYAHETQKVPDLNSRYWFNYIQCSPIFRNENTSVYADYLDDIKVRFENGITKFHHHPELAEGWNLDQDKENWETSVVNTWYLSKVKYADCGLDTAYVTDALHLGYKADINLVDSTLEIEYPTESAGLIRIKIEQPNQERVQLPWLSKGEIKARRINLWNPELSSDWEVIVTIS